MGKKVYDFSGWATRCNVKCSDGRTIMKDAFVDNDKTTVPLVWQHNHTDADNVLGHALLENRAEGVYAYCSLNNTPEGRRAKELVEHGDICSLSIYANQLKQTGGNVIHGLIREVSLVLAGANPGARIMDVNIAHGDNADGDAYIFNASETLDIGTEVEDIEHSDNNKEGENMPNKEEKEEIKVEHSDEGNDEETIQDVFNTLSEKQKKVVYAMIGMALEDKENGNAQEDKEMKHNAFDTSNEADNQTELMHSEVLAAIEDAKKSGSMKDAFISHGITNVDTLFPEVQAVNKTPELIARDTNWVSVVMGGVKHTPFSRVKSTAANITADEARARGYIKGKQKISEVITALKRTTLPTTVYKLQKMDRDDVIDITDFDVVAWLKQEMRGMLDEELARAFLIGDGRDGSDDSKINEQNIRPILGDNSTYTVSRTLTRTSGETDSDFAKDFIKDVVKSRKEYKGSGNPILFTTEDLLTEMLLIEDKIGHRIYKTEAELATALRVSKIVTVPVFEGHKREVAGKNYALMGILVNLADYNVGADKGGAVNMFDDFDIDYNKYEYLIETRCSGALVKPYSAITFEEKLAEPSSSSETGGEGSGQK